MSKYAIEKTIGSLLILGPSRYLLVLILQEGHDRKRSTLKVTPPMSDTLACDTALPAFKLFPVDFDGISKIW
jgi:hypothetical protein